MPLAELVQSTDTMTPPVGVVTCPNCRVPMPRISLKPSRADLNEAVYRCPRCETETMRWIKL
jgi:transposase-like protein